jgi:hypothetical protein
MFTKCAGGGEIAVVIGANRAIGSFIVHGVSAGEGAVTGTVGANEN